MKRGTAAKRAKEALAKQERQRRAEAKSRQDVIEEALNSIRTAKRTGDMEEAEAYCGYASDILERSGHDDLARMGQKLDQGYKAFQQANKLIDRGYDVMGAVERQVRNSGG
jgi:hypothetical protein